VTPLTVATPFIHFDSESTRQYLAQALVPFFQGAGSPDPAAAAAATAAQLAPGFARVPLGVISSQDVNANGPQILVTYFNVDEDLELYGTDLSATALITPTLSVEGTLSLVSDDIFETSRGTRVTLNAPKRKGSLAALYSGPSGLNAEARIRYTAGFPVVSGVYEGTACLGDEGEDVEPCVEAATLFDVNLGYPIPGVSGATVQLAIQNLFDEGYRSFPGVPNVGRMALLRIRYNLR
jgi:outer membrane receptor for ferrienterochelin and colicins